MLTMTPQARAIAAFSLAEAARFLAAPGLVVAVLATVGVLTNDQPFYGVFSLG